MSGIDNNTVLYLRGDSEKDLSPYLHNIAKNGTVSIVEKSLDFSKGNFVVNHNFASDLNGDFTFELYFSLNDVADAYNTILSECTKWNNWQIQYHGTRYTDAETPRFRLVYNGEEDIFITEKLNVSSNKFHHIAFVRHNGSLKIYLDGKKVALANNIYSGKGIINASSIYIGKDSSSNYFKGKIKDLRISNIARYTSEFTPPTSIFNSIDINITNQTEDKIDFNVSKLGQETINKVEVVVNNQVSKTYDNIGDLTYNIPSNSLSYGEKVIIRVTFDNDYTEEKEFNYEYKIDNLPTVSSLKDVIDRQELLTNAIEVQKNNLKSILESKNVVVSEEENKLSNLIGKVGELPSMVAIANLQANQEEMGNKISILECENKALKEELTQIQTSIASLTSLITATLEEK